MNTYFKIAEGFDGVIKIPGGTPPEEREAFYRLNGLLLMTYHGSGNLLRDIYLQVSPSGEWGILGSYDGPYTNFKVDLELEALIAMEALRGL